MYDSDQFPEGDMQELANQGDVDVISSTCPALDLEVAIFFDGTGNNLSNVDEGNRLRAQNGEGFMHEEDSYNNDYSNVAKLYKVHLNTEAVIRNSCGGIAIMRERAIIDGIGTTSGEGDSKKGFAIGWGQSGVEARAAEGFRALTESILKVRAQGEVKSIKIDVFGFSRGSAAARHFVNCVLRGYVFSDIDLHLPGRETVVIRPEDHALIEIRFLGIFDTVVSWGLVANDQDNGELMISLDGGSIKKILHITALDEHRENFPLTEAPSEAETIRMPGAHSDIGGGYPDFWVERTEIKKSDALFADLAAHVDKLDPSPIENQLSPEDEALWLDQVRLGWLLPTDRGAIVRSYTPTGPTGHPSPYHVQWHMERKWLNHHLSHVALHLMHRKAVEAGVPLPPLPNDNNHRIDDPVLKGLLNDLLAGKSLGFADSIPYRRNYVHHSASWTPSTGFYAMKPHIGAARRTVYNNDGSVKLN